MNLGEVNDALYGWLDRQIGEYTLALNFAFGGFWVGCIFTWFFPGSWLTVSVVGMQLILLGLILWQKEKKKEEK